MSRIDYEIGCFDRVLSVEVSEQDKEKAYTIMDASYWHWCESDICDCCEEYILSELQRHNVKFEYIFDYFAETMEQIESGDFESVKYAIDRIQELYKAGNITLAERNKLIILA